MIWATVAVVLGIALIVISADKFVEGAASLASRLGMSHFLIGLTIVSVGTSAPELLVSAVAAFDGSPGLALGNALGSNITNIALVLGVTAFIFRYRSRTLGAANFLYSSSSVSTLCISSSGYV